MDKRIRRNELCVVGLPRCDFVFSSTRTCFIGYGFGESTLEMTIMRNLLKERNIQAVEASGTLAPGQNAFCAKICSKIIVSQFCAILLNNDLKDGFELPNANVNMEYGLMLGFNKYVIPFQRDGQELPFNVAGLDTVKYDDRNFERLAIEAIDLAIKSTTQESTPTLDPDQVLEAFLLSKRLLIVPILNEGDQALFELGRPLGFNMLMSFDGMKYVYFGNFTALRPEVILWRLRTLEEIIQERVASVPQRIKMGFTIDPTQLAALETLLSQLQIFVLVTSASDQKKIEEAIAAKPTQWKVQVSTLDDIEPALRAVT